MPRFFVSPSQIAGDTVQLSGADAHHATRVLRLAPGDALTVLDGSGTVYEAVIEAASKEGLTARVIARAQAPEPPVPLTLIQALPKGEKLEWILQKGTELGAERIVVVPTARSVAQLKADKADNKLGRWQKIAQEAAEQSERGRVPEVVVASKLSEVAWPEGTLVLVLSERHGGRTLPQALPESAPSGIAVCVGPEGGWTREELDALVARGALEVSLGSRILRTETAGLAALAILMARYEL